MSEPFSADSVSIILFLKKKQHWYLHFSNCLLLLLLFPLLLSLQHAEGLGDVENLHMNILWTKEFYSPSC